jgi:cytochrome b561
MGMRSDGQRYGAVAMAMHWVTAAAVFGLLGSGLVMADATDEASRATLLQFHAATGFAVGVLTVLRILWWLFADDRPARTGGTPLWQARAAGAVHGLFYVVILMMVSSGVAMMVLSGAPQALLAGTPLPDFDAYVPRAPHSFGAWLMMGLIALHVCAALYHQFLLRDRLLARMGLGRA